LPIVICVNFLLQKKLRNAFILLCSLFFYAWGENVLVLLMMGSICLNYIFGILISNSHQKLRINTAKFLLIVGIVLNLSVLVYYKYINFFVDNLTQLGLEFDNSFSDVTLPIGVSFFTFQNLSYLVDV